MMASLIVLAANKKAEVASIRPRGSKESGQASPSSRWHYKVDCPAALAQCSGGEPTQVVAALGYIRGQLNVTAGRGTHTNSLGQALGLAAEPAPSAAAADPFTTACPAAAGAAEPAAASAPPGAFSRTSPAPAPALAAATAAIAQSVASSAAPPRAPGGSGDAPAGAAAEVLLLAPGAWPGGGALLRLPVIITTNWRQGRAGVGRVHQQAHGATLHLPY